MGNVIRIKELTDAWIDAYRKELQRDKTKSQLFKQDILETSIATLKDFQLQCERNGWKAIKI